MTKPSRNGSRPARRRNNRSRHLSPNPPSPSVHVPPIHPPGKTPRYRRSVPGSKTLSTLLPQLLIGAINVNCLTVETEWAVSTLLEEKKYDVM